MATHHTLGTSICFWTWAVESLKRFISLDFVMSMQNKCVYPVLWDLIRKHIWHSYEGQHLLNFHLVCMEDRQALDHLSPMHKAAAEWQKHVVLVEHHPVLPVLKQYLQFLLRQLESWALCVVQKQSCHTVLAQFRPVSIKEVRYQHAEPACSHTASQMHPCWDPHECAAATFQT